MRLTVHTRAGLPAFQLSASPLDDVAALTAAAAQRARVKTQQVRLSHAGRLLERRDTVQSLGLMDGDTLLLHVRTGHQPSSSQKTTLTHSFGGDGYGFFVHVVTSEGRALFRPKVRPTDDAATLIDASVARLRAWAGGAHGPTSMSRSNTAPSLSLRGRALKRGRTVQWHGISAGDELVLDVDAPISRASDGASNARWQSVRTDRGHTVGHRLVDRGASSQPLLSAADRRAALAPPKGGRAAAQLVDSEISAAADLMYDAVSREVKELETSNRRLRDELRRRGPCDDDYSDEYSDYSDEALGTSSRVRARRHEPADRALGGSATSATISRRTRDAFAAFDTNRSGFISNRELSRALAHYGLVLGTNEISKVRARRVRMRACVRACLCLRA
jgi:hypothetical protein